MSTSPKSKNSSNKEDCGEAVPDASDSHEEEKEYGTGAPLRRFDFASFLKCQQVGDDVHLC